MLMFLGLLTERKGGSDKKKEPKMARIWTKNFCLVKTSSKKQYNNVIFKAFILNLNKER